MFVQIRMRIFTEGQVSLFFIIGLILAVSVVFVVFLANNFEDEKADADFINAVSDVSSVNEVIDYVNFCLYQSVGNGLIVTGRNGGFAAPNSNTSIILFTNNGFESYPYYNNLNNVLVPSEEVVSVESAISAELLVERCLAELNSSDLSINYGSPEIIISFLDNNTLAKMNLPINISNDNKESAFVEFSTIIPFSYGSTYGAAKYFVSEQVKDLDSLALSDLMNVAHIYGFNFSRTIHNERNSLLTFNYGYDLFDESFEINFAIKHTSDQEVLS